MKFIRYTYGTMLSMCTLSCLLLSEFALAKNKHKKENEPDCYDYVVVGVGTAGAILIENLTADKKSSVLGLEWGQDLRNDPTLKYSFGTIPPHEQVNLVRVFTDQRYSENYLTQGAISFPFQSEGNWFADNPSSVAVAYSVGRTVGGTSVHATDAHRGSPQFYDTLAGIAGSRWSYVNVLPFLKGLETYALYPDNTPLCNAPLRGCTGPIQILQGTPESANVTPQWAALNDALAIIMQEQTPEQPKPPVLFGTDDWNAGFNTYTTSLDDQRYFIHDPSVPGGEIHSDTLSGIIAKITDQQGKGLDGRKLTIKSECFVERIIFHKNTAIGVEYIQGNCIKRAYAKKKVIISAGALRTPLILEQSGIGVESVLAASHIPVRKVNANVGENMRDNIYFGLIPQLFDPTFTFSFNTGGRLFLDTTGFSYPPFYLEQGYQICPQIFLDYGIFTSPFSQQPLSLITASPTVGSVHTATNSSSGQLFINMPFFSANADGIIEDLVLGEMGALYINNVMKAANAQFPEFQFSMFYPPQSVFDENEGNPSALDQFLLNSYKTGIHITGTCRIAPSEQDGVVDGDLHVHGFKNLMIADNSVIPLVVDANTMNLALVIGQVAASIIKNEGRCTQSHSDPEYFTQVVAKKEVKELERQKMRPADDVKTRLKRHEQVTRSINQWYAEQTTPKELPTSK